MKIVYMKIVTAVQLSMHKCYTHIYKYNYMVYALNKLSILLCIVHKIHIIMTIVHSTQQHPHLE